MRLGTTYICVRDIDKSLDFYCKLLKQEPSYANGNRWITFNVGNTLSLYNKEYDKQLLSSKDKKEHFNEAYMSDFNNEKEAVNTIMILNFEVDHLKEEYERVKALNIGQVSELMYVNVHAPYWYFNITDPDGNILEITGKYE